MNKKDLEKLAKLFTLDSDTTLQALNSFYAYGEEDAFRKETGMSFLQARKVTDKFLNTLDSFRN